MVNRLRLGLVFVFAFGQPAEAQPNVVSAKLAGPTPQQLSIAKVTDADADSNGRVYVADERQAKIQILDRDLRAVAEVGRPGSRDGEFRDLQGVRVIDSNSFVAVERYLRRLYVYRWQHGRPELESTLRLPFEPYDLCVLGRRRFLVLGLFQKAKLHEVDQNGKVLSSWALMDSTVTPTVADHIVQGRVACSADRKTVVVTSSWVPRVELFERGLTVNPTIAFLQPIRPLAIMGKGKSASFHSGREGFHSPERAIVGSSLILISARQRSRTDGVRGDSVRWYGYDRKSNRWTVYRESVGRLFPLGGDKALSVVEDDGTQLTLTSMREHGWTIASRTEPHSGVSDR